jgi:hypothetical protein
MGTRAFFLALAGLVCFVQGLGAQTRAYRPAEAAVGISFLVGDPTGEFSRFVDVGYGGEFFGRYPLEPQGLVSLRGDLGFLIYGYESSRVCFDGIGCRVQGRLQTSNGIFFGGIGPELALPLDWMRPYVNVILGFGYFSTTSSVESLWGYEDQLVTENLGDGTFSWAMGGGVEMNLKGGRTPIDLNFGVRYHENGVVKYLTEGDILDHPDGSITLFPIVSEANLLSFRAGLTVRIPRGGAPEE